MPARDAVTAVLPRHCAGNAPNDPSPHRMLLDSEKAAKASHDFRRQVVPMATPDDATPQKPPKQNVKKTIQLTGKSHVDDNKMAMYARSVSS